jgi:hypothetical protein
MYSSERIPVAPRSTFSLSNVTGTWLTPLPTVPTLSLQQVKHKAAIATNNNGVTLLNRGYYRQALETFQDSMKLMKSARGHLESSQVRPSLQSSPAKNDLSVWDIETLVRRSWKRCAECSRHNTATTTDDAHDILQQPPLPILYTISSQYSHECQSMAFAFCTFQSSLYVAFPMTIDPMDVYDHDGAQNAHCRSTMEYQLESAVLLYNYGIAYDCLAVMAARSGSQRALETLLREKTSRIYNMADALVQMVARNVSTSCANDTDTTTTTGTALQCNHHNHQATLLPRCLVIHAFVTYNLIQTCIQRNLPRLYRAHCRALDELLEYLAAHEQCLPTRDHCLAAAA